jgi:hypothetical protein
MKLIMALTTVGYISIGLSGAVAQNTGTPGQNLLDPSLNNPPATADSPLAQDGPPDATIRLRGGSVAAGIGYVWGSGAVNYQGVDHSFSINGISVLDVGGAHIAATGIVMHLEKIADFPGQYSSFGAGVTLAGGGSAVYLKNQHGVVIKLMSKTEGLRFNLGAGGVKVKLTG